MSRTYQVRILSAREWDRVVASSPRYAEVDATDLGFADPARGMGFVRDTSVPRLNTYLLNHEFEHLVEEAGTDEDRHGIRHKRLFSTLGPIFGSLGGGGPLGTIVGQLAGSGLDYFLAQRPPSRLPPGKHSVPTGEPPLSPAA